MKKFLNILRWSLPLLLVALAIYTLYVHFADGEFAWDHPLFHGNIAWYSGILLTIAVILLPLNLGLEAAKWRALNYRDRSISTGTAMKEVLRGYLTALVTPQRIGEAGGRISAISRDHRKRALSSFIAGSAAQFLTTLIFGCLGFAYLSKQGLLSDLPNWISTGLLIILLIITLPGIFLFFFPRKSFLILPLPELWKEKLKLLISYRKPDLLKALLLSILRYMVFATQYGLVLLAVGIDAAFIDLIALVSFTYLITTLVPASILGELGLRESAALLVMTPVLGDPLGIIAATTLIWLINLLLPALTGSSWWISDSIRFAFRKTSP